MINLKQGWYETKNDDLYELFLKIVAYSKYPKRLIKPTTYRSITLLHTCSISRKHSHDIQYKASFGLIRHGMHRSKYEISFRFANADEFNTDDAKSFYSQIMTKAPQFEIWSIYTMYVILSGYEYFWTRLLLTVEVCMFAIRNFG